MDNQGLPDDGIQAGHDQEDTGGDGDTSSGPGCGQRHSLEEEFARAASVSDQDLFDKAKEDAGSGSRRRSFIPDEWMKPPGATTQNAAGIWEGLGVVLLGVLAPAALALLTCTIAAKRITLVTINHPLETILEFALVAAIPLINWRLFRSIRRGDMRFPALQGLASGLAIGAGLLVAAVSSAGLLFASNEFQRAIGHTFDTGFMGIAMVGVFSALTGIYLVNKVRLSRDFAQSRRQVLVYPAIGVLLAALCLFASETRSFCVRLAEKKAASSIAREHREGMGMLRQLNPIRDLKLEASDARAGGLAGLFIPIKQTTQHRLYFALGGRPLIAQNDTNMSAMPDDYISKHAVGSKIEGLSLLRSTLNAIMHPDTLSSTINWTYVFKNETTEAQEIRAEIGLPDGAVISGLTLWHDGEPQDATVAVTGNIPGQYQWSTAGHDCPAIVTPLGRGRYLLHCYPVLQDEELKVRLQITAPLKSETTTQAFVTLPRLVASNFDLSGEHVCRVLSPQALATKCPSLKADKTPTGIKILTGKLDEPTIANTGVTVNVARPQAGAPVAVLDNWVTYDAQKASDRKAEQEAARLRERLRRREQRAASHRRQMVVMLDARRDLRDQVEDIERAIDRGDPISDIEIKAKKVKVKPHYIVQTMEKSVAPQPKHLVIVVDGSVGMDKYRDDLVKALGTIPDSVATSVIIASEDTPKTLERLTRSQAITAIKHMNFIGGQDNLQAVIKAAELAGETKGGVVMWVHGPQALFNREIYILSPYAAKPAFWELPVDGGEVDTFEFFKNHSEVGPFAHVPRSGVTALDLSDFFAKWKGDRVNYAVSYNVNVGEPKCQIVDDLRGRELLLLRAFERCNQLIAQRKMTEAATIAVRYRLVTPVSTAMVVQGAQTAENSTDNANSTATTAELPAKEQAAEATAASTPADGYAAMEAPELQGATNGTIGPQGNDATVIQGINCAGTVRVNNLANLEALLNIVANGMELIGLLVGGVIACNGLFSSAAASAIMGIPVPFGRKGRVALGVAIAIVALSVPGIINWFVASARDANLFS